MAEYCFFRNQRKSLTQCSPKYPSVTMLALKAFLNNKWYFYRKVFLVSNDRITIISKWRVTICGQLTCAELSPITNYDHSQMRNWFLSPECLYFVNVSVRVLLRSFFHIGIKHYLLKNRPLDWGSQGPALATPGAPKLPGVGVGVGTSCGHDGQALVFRVSVAFPWVQWLSAPSD